MATAKSSNIVETLTQDSYLFRGLDEHWLNDFLPSPLKPEKLYSNRPVYTAFNPEESLSVLYILLSGGPVITRSAPLDRVITITYSGSCFGMRNLPLSYGLVSNAFPSLVEAYKTTDVLKLPIEVVQEIYNNSEMFRCRYDLLFALREKFQYHLLNCSTYPPQAVATLLRALIYQERALGNQPDEAGTYTFDLPVDVIARACQLNHRTVEQVLKGMQKAGLLAPSQASDLSNDIVRAIDPEGLKEIYSATRDKVAWWSLRGS